MCHYQLEDQVPGFSWERTSPEAPSSVRTFGVFRIEGMAAMALNQLGANSWKPRDLESLGPSISVIAGAWMATAA